MRQLVFTIAIFLVVLIVGAYIIAPRPPELSPLSPWGAKRSQPVITADQPWEEGVVQEPDVHLEGGKYKMWYTAGWGRALIAYADSDDGIRWIKRGPIMGMGAGGFAGAVAHHSVLIHNSIYYLFFADTRPQGAALYVAMSSDGLHFQPYQTILEPGEHDLALANTAVWIEGEAWHMLYESRTAGGRWQLFLAEGSDATHWRKMAGPLIGLSRGGMYGGPWIVQISGGYRLTYHATRSGDLPSDIYQAESADLVNWKVLDDRPIVARSLPWEVDQVADPSIAGGKLYYDGMDNVKPKGAIGLIEQK